MTFIYKSLGAGFFRSLKVWKGIFIIWLFSFVLISLYVLPVKNILFAGFGKSMITTELQDHFNPEVFYDLGPDFTNIKLSAFKGMPFLFLIFFAANAFFTAGLFCNLRKKSETFSLSEFFRSGAEKFWPYFGITLIITGLITIFFFIYVLISTIAASSIKISSEKTGFIFALSALVLFLLLMPVLILIADYARSWQAATLKKSSFRAVGFGIRTVFRKFWSSYFLMMILLLVQLILTITLFWIIAYLRPSSFTGVLLLFLFSQFMVFIRLLIKTWRYASVTALMEKYAGNDYPFLS